MIRHLHARRRRLTALAAAVWALPAWCAAQDLTPRAYTLTPTGSNAITLSYLFTKGDILFDPAIPITDARSTIHTPILSYYYAFDFFSRSANFSASLPWTSGDFSGRLPLGEAAVRREGFGDSVFRFAVNLTGGPALKLPEFVKRPPPRTVIGASIRVVAPTGTYDSFRVVNPGNNRWAFKPEVGLSRRHKRVLLDGYAGVWIYTDNKDYLALRPGGPAIREQSPIASFEGHVSYDVKPRMWVSLDLNYWYGGKTTVNGVESDTSTQSNSRIGITGSLPITARGALRASFSNGMITRVGGEFKILSVAWQYSWF